MKRKSNFDVTPEQFAAMKQQAQAVAASFQPQLHYGAGSVAMQQFGAAAVQNLLNTHPYLPMHSLYDQKYKDKLDAALKRSFDYVRRVDAIAAGLIPEPAVAAPQIFAKQFKQLNRPRPVHSRPGIGSTSQRANEMQATSVYVAGLPLQFTHTQLEGLFSAYGKVTRCKFYKDERGQPKGDALVTFAKPTSATNACKMNGFALTPQHTISVTPADFSAKQREEAAKLPPECEADQFPVVLFRNMYIAAEAHSDPNFFIELEADLLETFVKFGKIRRIVSPEDDIFEGAVAVTFADEDAAKKCADAMAGRFFDGREVETELIGSFWSPSPSTTGAEVAESKEGSESPGPAALATEAVNAANPVLAEQSVRDQAQAASVPTGAVVVAAAPPNVRSSQTTAPPAQQQEPSADPLAAFLESIGELEKSVF